MSLAHGNKTLEVSRVNDMHFVYAFFFLNGDTVHIKVGESTTPYKRLASVLHGCPFPVQEAVFCHIGSMKQARNFESSVRHSLNHRRTRGEWYMMKRDDAKEFKDAVIEAYTGCTGRPLKWTKIDLVAFADGREGGAQPKRLNGKGGRPKLKPLTRRDRVLSM